MRNIPTITKNLIIINIIFFLATKLNADFMYATFSLYYPGSSYFHIWQLVTHLFMHGNFMHLFFNMYTLMIFGSVLENMLGEKKFLLFYFVCGLGAAACHIGVEFVQAQSFMAKIADGSQAAVEAYARLKAIPTVGASGAIYGVLIGYALFFPNATLTLIFPPISLSAKWWVLIFVGVELITGVTGTADGVAHFAHLGGMLFGWLLICYWRKRGTLYDRY